VTPAETERMHELCDRIQVEKDRKKFMLLVDELNALVAYKNDRLEAKEHPKT
jgi:hypothetical protein